MTNKRKIYLELFNLNESATVDDIKKRYRELAKMLHPDRNKEKNAHERFLLIKEAYEYLISNPYEKSQTLYYENIDLEKERIEKIRLAKEKLKEYYKRQDEIFQKKYHQFEHGIIYKSFNYFAIFGLILSLSIILDLSFPSQKQKTIITEISENYNSLSQNQIVLIKTLNNKTFYTNNLIKEILVKNDSVVVESSYILKRVLNIKLKDNFNTKSFSIGTNKFYIMILFCLYFILPSIILFKKSKTREYIFLVSLFSTFYYPILLFFVSTYVHFF